MAHHILTGCLNVAVSCLKLLYRIIDKTDKIGLDGVAQELRKDGLPDAVVDNLVGILAFDGTGSAEKRLVALSKLREELDEIPIAMEGIQELEDLTRMVDSLGVPSANTQLDFTMVRGLGYYTGAIFETIITKPDNLGSVQGGGRYDEMIGHFRGQSLPTCGISLGIERIMDLMDMLDLYPDWVKAGTVVQVLVTVFSDDLQIETMQLAAELREADINAEAYLDPRKNLGKQIGYADGKHIPIIAVIAPDEVTNGVVKLKRLSDGAEATVRRDAVADQIWAWLGVSED